MFPSAAQPADGCNADVELASSAVRPADNAAQFGANQRLTTLQVIRVSISDDEEEEPNSAAQLVANQAAARTQKRDQMSSSDGEEVQMSSSDEEDASNSAAKHAFCVFAAWNLQ